MKDVCILSFHFLNKDFSEHHFEKKKRSRTAFRIPTWNGQILRRLSDILAGGGNYVLMWKLQLFELKKDF